jgi:outer membrane biosynthesis protein TonB
MGSGKAEKPSKNPKKKRKPLSPNRVEVKPKSVRKREKNRADLVESKIDNEKSQDQEVQAAPAAEQQLSFFLDQFQSANGVQLSSLELDSIKGTFDCPSVWFPRPEKKIKSVFGVLCFSESIRYVHCGAISRYGPRC